MTHLLAKSVEVRFRSGRASEQVHLGFTENMDEMRIMFLTRDCKERQVRYKVREGKLNRVVVAHVERDEKEHMCKELANSSVVWRDPGWIHDVVMENLKKGVKYYYQVIFCLIGFLV